MADFKTALEALAAGKITIDTLSNQLDKLLQATPGYALSMLQQLDESHTQKKIDDKAYTALKRQINQYRRAHAAETEGGKAGSESTVFAQGDNFAKQAQKLAKQIAGQDVPAAGGDEEVTAVRETPPSKKSAVKATAGDEEATEVKGAAARPAPGGAQAVSDSTQVMDAAEQSDAAARSASTAGGKTAEVDFDLHTTDTGASPSVAGATGPTGTAWQQPAAADYVPGKELGVGDVIKHRFKLLDVLGVGGMGKVFKGIDLLKEEARDKNPYMAIKLLNEDFKSHPEAFISLQRESSRQQKLAHPNIATVYDFDRIGGPGTPVFITMELMEGQPLNTYIKKVVRKSNGIPFPEAFKIVKQLADALGYAHARRLVHSDFKPGNAFLCNDGTVKTLDFGIARAVKNPVTGEAEKTLFDPGKLGALTPAYASLEMLEGAEPDTRDDIYALGCVAYELLTGKHPYNKLPATTARENGLVPPIVKGLNKKSNRGLRRAVAFKREDRSQTVEQFIEEFEGKPTWHKHPATIAAGVLLIIGLIMINPILGYFNEREIVGIIADMNTGDKQVIIENLEDIQERPADEQRRILDDARDAIQNYYRGELAVLIDVSGNTYNFPEALKIIETIASLYPESVFLAEQRREFDTNKNQKVNELNKDYIAALNDTSRISATRDILNIIRNQIDPAHPLLSDPRPANAYRLAAEMARDSGDYAQAQAYIDAGLQSAADDPRLADLRVEVNRLIERTELDQALTAVQGQLAALTDYQPHQANIIRLAQISTPEQTPVLQTLSDQLQGIITAELQRIQASGSRADAENLVNSYEGLLSSLLLANELTQLKLTHLSGAERTQAIGNMVNADRANIDTRLAQPNPDDPQWESSLLASIRELDSLSGEDNTIAADLTNYRATVAQLYMDRANVTLQEQRFDAANALVDRAGKFAPDLALLQETRTRIADSRTEFDRQQRIKGLKDNFIVQTDGDDTVAAQQTLDELKTLLPADDAYITSTAPRMLASSYARLAENRGANGAYSDAMQLIEAGLALAPNDPTLRELRDEYVVEVNISELTELFKIASAANFDPTEVERKVDEIQNNPDRFTEFNRQAETLLAERIRALAATSEDEAASLADAASNIFRTSSVLADLRSQYQLKPWPEYNLAQTLVGDGKLTEANGLLQSAAAEYSGHPDYIRFQQALESRIKQANEIYDAYLQQKDAAGSSFNDLRQARKQLTRAQSIWIDNPDYDAAEDDINTLIASAPDNPANRVLAREQAADLSATGAGALAAAQADWKPIASPRQCSPNLAGHGKRARAICFDMVYTGWRGPQMVVVPAGESHSTFAIGKYEISVGDYSKYCALTGNCRPEMNQAKHDNPMTGISLEDAEKYAEWLSQRTGKKYRIPTKAEWEYAANAAGEQPTKNVNCRLELSGKVIKGTGVASVREGNSNGWGLKNYLGNVQEIVKDDSGGTLAVGGAYSDQHSKCDISLQRPHPGSGDDVTGFRILLEEISSG
jgi:serine/threonine protein kinase